MKKFPFILPIAIMTIMLFASPVFAVTYGSSVGLSNTNQAGKPSGTHNSGGGGNSSGSNGSGGNYSQPALPSQAELDAAWFENAIGNGSLKAAVANAIKNMTGRNGDNYRTLMIDGDNGYSHHMDQIYKSVGATTRKWIRDNYFEWDFRNNTTGARWSVSTPGNSYTWIANQVGQITVVSRPNATYRYQHNEYFTIVAREDGNHVHIITRTVPVFDRYETIMDDARDKTWTFTVTEQMLGKPLPIPPRFNGGQDIPIPSSAELVQ